MRKFLWVGRVNSLHSWLSQFSPTGQIFFSTFHRNFPISFKSKVALLSRVHLENAKRNLVFHFGGGRHASFPQNLLLRLSNIYIKMLPNFIRYFHSRKVRTFSLQVKKFRIVVLHIFFNVIEVKNLNKILC